MNIININRSTENDQLSFSDFTLIIPSVSVGNVPQLTVDLLITTYDFKRISTIWHPALIPSIGSDPYSNSSEIYTACELYFNKELKLATMQLRSTVENKLALKFFNDLRELVLRLHFKQIFILSSAFDYELHNVLGEKFYFISTTENEVMEMCHVKPLQPTLNGIYCLNGGGFAVKLYQTLQEHIPCTLLMKYVSEGDNRPDAFMMLQRLFAVLGLTTIPPLKVKCPTSWQFVFGGPPPLGIY